MRRENRQRKEGEVMATDKEIDGWTLEQFREKAPDLLELAEAFLAGANERWHVSAVADGPGWWGKETGFFLDTYTGTLPGHDGPGCWTVIWVGKDYALLDLRWNNPKDGETYTQDMYRMSHGSLTRLLNDLPKPFWAYGVEEINNEEVK